MVIRGPAQLVVDQGAGGKGRAAVRQRTAVEPVLQDRIDVPVRPGPDRDGPGTGRFEPERPVPLREP